MRISISTTCSMEMPLVTYGESSKNSKTSSKLLKAKTKMILISLILLNKTLSRSRMRRKKKINFSMISTVSYSL